MIELSPCLAAKSLSDSTVIYDEPGCGSVTLLFGFGSCSETKEECGLASCGGLAEICTVEDPGCWEEIAARCCRGTGT